MTVPSYQEFMLPLLHRVSDRLEHRLSDLYDDLARIMLISEDDRSEMLASGKQSRFENRIGWAKTYLQKAGLVESPRRGFCSITPRGIQVLDGHPAKIDVSFLRQFPEFIEFTQVAQTGPSAGSIPVIDEASEDESPEERLDNAYRRLRTQLTQDILAEIHDAPPSLFERLVLDLLLKMGYGGTNQEGWVVGRSGDEGIDGIINEDKLGLDVIYIQAKRWEGTVGRPEIQKFAGSLEGQRATKGVFITSSQFSSEAKDYVSRIGKRIVLIDGKALAEHLIEFGVAVDIVTTYTVRRVDKAYFAGESVTAAE